MKSLKLTLQGRPTTKKNSPRVVRMGGFTKVLPSKAYEDYEKGCLWQLMRYKHQSFSTPVHLKCLYYMPDKRAYPDLQGLLQATADILEKARIIENDRLIVIHDGSRIAGLDKNNPRVEIEIMEMPEDDISYSIDPYLIKQRKAKSAVSLFG